MQASMHIILSSECSNVLSAARSAWANNSRSWWLWSGVTNCNYLASANKAATLIRWNISDWHKRQQYLFHNVQCIGVSHKWNIRIIQGPYICGQINTSSYLCRYYIIYSYSWYAVKCQQCRQVMLFEKLLPPLRQFTLLSLVWPLW